mmetsp:Transcript_132995/g.323250  ORF Transcript_132995/g.323250 Transcript_132995/m.323250 type:complete len:274 (-) Transcript_132995:828-1649(-)
MPLALSRQKSGRSVPKVRRQKTEVKSARAVWRLRKGAAAHWGSSQMIWSMTPRTQAAKAMTPKKRILSVLDRHHWISRRWMMVWNWARKPLLVRNVLPWVLCRAVRKLNRFSDELDESLSLPISESNALSFVTCSCKDRRYSRNSCFVTTSMSGPAMQWKSSSTTSSSGFVPSHRASSRSSSPSSITPFLSVSMLFHSSSNAPAKLARSSSVVQRRTLSDMRWGLKSRLSHMSKSMDGWNLPLFWFSTSPEITSMNQSAGFSLAGISKPMCSK